MPKSKSVAGEINRHGQRLVAKTEEAGTDHDQHIWIVECTRPDSKNVVCGKLYGSNSSDFFQRKCPACQGGAPGPSIDDISWSG